MHQTIVKRRQLTVALMLAPSIWVSPAYGQANGTVQPFDVPAHAALCAQSQPLSVSPETDPEFGNIVFRVLYDRIQKAAMEAQLTSTGVPYLASTRVIAPSSSPPTAPPASEDATNAPAATNDDANPAQQPSSFIVRVCAVVEAAPAVVPTGLEISQRPAHRVYGMRCDARYVEDCKATVTEALRDAGVDVAEADALNWWMRQAITGGDTPADLARALSDHTLRPLAPDSAAPEAPVEFVVVAAEVPT